MYPAYSFGKNQTLKDYTLCYAKQLFGPQILNTADPPSWNKKQRYQYNTWNDSQKFFCGSCGSNVVRSYVFCTNMVSMGYSQCLKWESRLISAVNKSSTLNPRSITDSPWKRQTTTRKTFSYWTQYFYNMNQN